MTFCGAAEAIVHAGLRPVLVDVEPHTGLASPRTVATAVRTCGRPSAMVVLHFAGAPAPVEELAEAAGLGPGLVVEDAAHALGTFVGGRPVGALSGAACFSFYATKNLPVGEGGMVTTDNEQTAAWIHRARLHGMSADAWRRNAPGGDWAYTVEEAGLKANMTDVQAAIGRAQLRHLDGWQRRREAVARRYEDGLRQVPGLVLPAGPPAGRHAWHLYVVRVLSGFGTGRDELIGRLAERGIGTSVQFIPLHHMPYFRRHAIIPPEGLLGAESLFPQLLSLPMYPALPERAVDRVCAEIARLAPAPRRVPAARPAAARHGPRGPTAPAACALSWPVRARPAGRWPGICAAHRASDCCRWVSWTTTPASAGRTGCPYWARSTTSGGSRSRTASRWSWWPSPD
ncbi:hypothetical protein AR457_27785 [Streptomyces agglomeratus]|nr:hypothetical protein BGK70_08870 [Streptomyces agglomeratus]OEJ47375.1 hypothetical protein AR457_27785 [Streptomyces agglomeratus]